MADDTELSRSSAGFGLAAAIAILFNTVLACVKDANPGLSKWMGSLFGHNWTTQGVFDLVIFFGLGLVFTKSGWAGTMSASRLIAVVTGAVVIAGVGLAVWYAVF